MEKEKMRASFCRDGYYFWSNLIPNSFIDSVLESVPEKRESSGIWEPTIYERTGTDDENAAIHKILVHPNVIDAAETFLEDDPRIYYGMLAVVPAHGGKGLPWHQDNMYEGVYGRAINIFIALCDISVDMAILWVAPETHQMGIQQSKSANKELGEHREATEDPENGIPLPPMKKGDACVFDRNLLHRSVKNSSNKDRYAYAAQYMASRARLFHDGEIPDFQMARNLQKHYKEIGVVDFAQNLKIN